MRYYTVSSIKPFFSFKVKHMTPKDTSLDMDYLVAEYRSGRTGNDLAREVGVSPYKMIKALRAAGVQIRDGNKSHIEPKTVIARWDAGGSLRSIASEFGVTDKVIRRILDQSGVHFENRWIKKLPGKEVVDMFLSGVGIRGVADAYEVAPGVIARILREHGIKPRDRAEQQAARMARCSPEERLELVKAAHDAVRGVPHTEEQRVKVAITREKRQTSVSHYERAIAALVKKRGLAPTLQKAIGRYNCDLAIDPVAVEIFGGGWHWTGDHLDRSARRLRYFLDSGWHVLMIRIDREHIPLRGAIADYIVSYVNEVRNDPSRTREYRVVRGAGKLLTAGSADDDYVSIIPSASDGMDPILGRYKGISR